MLTKKTLFACALLLALSAVATPARAEDSRLAEARQAYAAVDYENTRALSRAAIEQGSNDRAATGELYFLWALAAAAQDLPDEARTAFNYALAVNPDLKVDRGLSPKIRAPYQEARGALTRADGKPPLEARLRRKDGRLELALHDTQGLVDHVELATRGTPGAAFARQRFRAAPSRLVSAPDGRELEFFVRLLDTHGNVLLEVGTSSEPERLPAVFTPDKRASHDVSTLADVNRTPYYVTAAALGALGLAAGGLSTAMFLRREDAAADWNGPGCEKPGPSRAEQCAKTDDRRRSAEHLAVGFAATSGALLVGGVISLLLAPSRERPSVALDTTPHSVLLRLGTTL